LPLAVCLAVGLLGTPVWNSAKASEPHAGDSRLSDVAKAFYAQPSETREPRVPDFGQSGVPGLSPDSGVPLDPNTPPSLLPGDSLSGDASSASPRETPDETLPPLIELADSSHAMENPLPADDAYSTGGFESESFEGDFEFEQMGEDPYLSEAWDSATMACGDSGCRESGHCSSCGPCDRGPRWFAGVEFVYVERNRTRKVETTEDQNLSYIARNPLGQLTLVDPVVLHTRSIPDLPFEPGLRTRIGTNLGFDYVGRRHLLEFEHLGLVDWDANAEVGSTGTLGALIPGGTIFFGSLFVPSLDPSYGGFNRAMKHRLDYSSRLNSFELNYRIRRTLGPDRDIYRPDTGWVRECTPGPTPSLFAGVRYVKINETCDFSSEGVIAEIPSFTSVDNGGLYHVETRNDMFGLQIGGDYRIQNCRWNFSVRGKVGGFVNVINQISQVNAFGRDDLFLMPHRDVNDWDETFSFIGEVGFLATYELFENVHLRLAYDWMLVESLALAPEQLDFDFTDANPGTNDRGSILYQGLSTGVELRW
jgi:hypothetical protein